MESSIKEFIESQFKYFHAHPELSDKEFETTRRIRNILTEHQIKVLDLPLQTGLAAVIGRGDKVIALRCDIDALAVCEQTSLEYKSENDGIMHACGHDSHICAVLGAALMLKEHEDTLNKCVKIIFQCSEEIGAGAKKFISTGVIDDVEAIFGIHCEPSLNTGTLSIRTGPTHASVEKFRIELKGVGAHAAQPHQSVDVILMAANFITTVQSIVSRNTDPCKTAVISVTHIDAGTSWNILPDTAFIEGTIRSFDNETRALCKSRFESILHSVAKTFGGSAELSFDIEVSATDNDDELAKLSKQAAIEENLNVVQIPQLTISEDFALYQEKTKGMFILFGSGPSAPLHNPKFKVNMDYIYPTAKYLYRLISKY